MEEKLVDLETKFSFQEDLLQGLNEVVVKQQQDIERLSIEVKHLQEQLLDLLENPQAEGEMQDKDEKPPHY